MTVIAGCNQKTEHNEPKSQVPFAKINIFGFDFAAATKKIVTKKFSDENIAFIQSTNKWEEVWDAGFFYKDASKIKVGFTENEDLAYLQFDFDKNSQKETVKEILTDVESKHGAPTNIEGDIDSAGEYQANWDIEDGVKIILKREFPTYKTNLTYFNNEAFNTLKAEYKIDIFRKAEIERDRVNSLY